MINQEKFKKDLRKLKALEIYKATGIHKQTIYTYTTTEPWGKDVSLKALHQICKYAGWDHNIYLE